MKNTEIHSAEVDPVRFLTAVDYFDKAARDFENPGWGLSDALYHFACIFNPKRSIDDEQARNLVAAIERARDFAFKQFPQDYPRQRIDVGMGAAIALTLIWAGRAGCTDRGVIRDLQDFCRILRNDAHNLSMLQDIRSRREARSMLGQTAMDRLAAIAGLGGWVSFNSGFSADDTLH